MHSISGVSLVKRYSVTLRYGKRYSVTLRYGKRNIYEGFNYLFRDSYIGSYEDGVRTWFSKMKNMEKRWPNMVKNFESTIANKETLVSGYVYCL